MNKVNTPFCVFLIIVGVGFLAGSLWFLWSGQKFEATAERVSGTIIALQRGTGKGSHLLHPVVEYADRQGRRYRMVGGANSFDNYSLNQSVNILYDPQQPARARIDNNINPYTGGMVMVMIGIFFILAGSFLYTTIDRTPKSGES